jgi:hypothetical protein
MSVVNYSVLSRDLFPSEIMFIEPVNFIKYVSSIDKRESGYLLCPAVQDFYKNVFIVLAPLDITITYDKENNRVNISGNSGINQEFFDTYIKIRQDQPQNNDRFLLSTSFLQLVFYSQDSITYETLPVFTAYTKNSNYNVIPGKFNISRWIRPIDFTFEFVDDELPVVIKRGEPLFTFRLSSQDGSKVELLREMNNFNKELYHTMNNFTAVKEFSPKLSLETLYQMAEPVIKLFWKNKVK